MVINDNPNVNIKPVAIFPGSFDPFTLAYNQLVIEASKLFHIVILICVNPYKDHGLFTPEERKQIILSVFKKYNYTPDSISVEIWPGLVTEFCKQHNIKYVVRGIHYKNMTEELDLSHIYYDDAKLKSVFFPMYQTELEYISSTRVREYIKRNTPMWNCFVPDGAVAPIRSFLENKNQ